MLVYWLHAVVTIAVNLPTMEIQLAMRAPLELSALTLATVLEPAAVAKSKKTPQMKSFVRLRAMPLQIRASIVRRDQTQVLALECKDLSRVALAKDPLHVRWPRVILGQVVVLALVLTRRSSLEHAKAWKAKSQAAIAWEMLRFSATVLLASTMVTEPIQAIRATT